MYLIHPVCFAEQYSYISQYNIILAIAIIIGVAIYGIVHTECIGFIQSKLFHIHAFSSKLFWLAMILHPSITYQNQAVYIPIFH